MLDPLQPFAFGVPVIEFSMVDSARGRALDKSRAIARAEAVLLSALSPTQQAQYRQFGNFDVTVTSKSLFRRVVTSTRHYRITSDPAYNVLLIKNGKTFRRYCAIPCENVPQPYIMLSQLLMLQTDEAKFLVTANYAPPL